MLAYAGQILVPGFLGRALPLAVLVAVIGTTQMQMTEPSRILYSMARDKLILAAVRPDQRRPQHAGLGHRDTRLHPAHRADPYLANTSATKAIGYVISASGLLYLAMYSIIALSCVWFSRYEILQRKGCALITCCACCRWSAACSTW